MTCRYIFNLLCGLHFWKKLVLPTLYHALSCSLVDRVIPTTTVSFSWRAFLRPWFNKLFSSNKLTRNNSKTKVSCKMLDVATRWPNVIKQIACVQHWWHSCARQFFSLASSPVLALSLSRNVGREPRERDPPSRRCVTRRGPEQDYLASG